LERVLLNAPIDTGRVGGRYLSGYWQKDYTVLAREIGGDWIRIRWADGEIAEHLTAWDARHDRVLQEPPCGTCDECREGIQCRDFPQKSQAA